MLWSEHAPLRSFNTLEDVVDNCVLPMLHDEGLNPDDYDPVGIALSISKRLNDQWIAQTILLPNARWWHLLPEDPVKRLAELARIADQAVRRAEKDGNTVELPAMKQERARAASTAYRAGASAELIAKRMHREAYRVYEWIKDANDGQLPPRA